MTIAETKSKKVPSGTAPWMSGDNKPGASGGSKRPTGTPDKKMVARPSGGPRTDVVPVTISKKGKRK